MNVFEDLIIELKEENLLESTVIEEDGHDSFLQDVEGPMSDRSDEAPTEVAPAFEQTVAPADVEVRAFEAQVDTAAVVDTAEAEIVTAAPEQAEPQKKPATGREAFKKRAVTEVSSLQMVEHVLTGVEREYMKVVPNVFDDLTAKRALHSFLNVADDADSEAHSSAEFTLMQETEAWCTALAVRDENIPVSSLRLYCENSRPALSSQALVGLARFYRNLPCSEQVRAKFDFTITRLFSRPIDQEQRVCLFTRTETLTHINTLYREWSSIPLYTAEEDESKVMLTALSFEDLAVEAEGASTFDQLIESDFFGRLRLFKESIAELFFAPNVTAAAIECNIRIGNSYVNLIDRERRKMDDASIQSKYGDLHDQAVSDAAARTLGLVELLRDRRDADTLEEEEEAKHVSAEPVREKTPPTRQRQQKPQAATKMQAFLAGVRENAFSINRWFLATAVVIIMASVGLWLWANFVIEDDTLTAGVQVVDVDNTFLKDQLKSARMSGETFYGLLQPTWEALPKEKRQEFLQRVLQAGKERGYTQVNLIGKGGRVVAHASPTRLDVVMP